MDDSFFWQAHRWYAFYIEAKSVDPDEMSHYVAFYLGLHYLSNNPIYCVSVKKGLKRKCNAGKDIFFISYVWKNLEGFTFLDSSLLVLFVNMFKVMKIELVELVFVLVLTFC